LKSTGKILRNNSFEAPRSKDKLAKPWRVGAYVSNATILFGFGESIELIDSNIASASKSLIGYPNSESPHRDESFRNLMVAMTPSNPKMARAFYFALIDFDF